ncbi:MAG: nucleotidyltransferase family protein [Acidobacteriota bacterium]
MLKNQRKKNIQVGGLLLAAGGSTRFGSPKQLAEFQGKTLLKQAAEAICGSGCSPVVVVLGASIEECKNEIEDLNLSIATNEQWQTGMASSIKTGLANLLKLEPDLDAVLITLMDQPLVTAEHLALMVERFKKDRPPIIATKYSDATGVPALFHRELFAELEKLAGEKGARELIRSRDDLVTVQLGNAGFDVDVQSDLLVGQ